MKSTLTLLLAVLLVGCNHSNNSETAKTKTAFEGFLKKFKQAELPLQIKACNIDDSTLNVLTLEKDSPFVTDQGVAYETIKTNGDYVAAISLFPADCFVPILTTYDKNGIRIDQKNISIGYCGDDCGYKCEEYLIIRSDYTIYVSDTITSTDCDSLGYEIPGTTKHYMIYKKGKLNTDGKIEMSDEIKEFLK
jgi:hypothetical protein